MFLFFVAVPTSAYEKQINIYFFKADGCPHCAKEELFLQTLENKYSKVKVIDLEITRNRQNLELLKKVGILLSAEVSGVPFTVIGNKYISGYADDKTTGTRIEAMVKNAQEGDYQNMVGMLLAVGQEETKPELKSENGGKIPAAATLPKIIKLPILGELEVKNLSLPALTFTIALLDGFNPCAMWVLVFLISLLLGMKNRLRMWLLGSTFILASGVVYFLFLSAWLNLFLFLGFIIWVRLIVGVFALGAGGYYLYDYWTNRQGACKVTEGKKRKKIFDMLKEIAHEKKIVLALVGIVFLAFAVNLIELICSAGLPAVYTQVLSLSKLPAWQYYLYLLLYIFIFMIDDLFVFIVAMITLKTVGIGTGYAHYSHLVGGVIMLLLGLFLIFKPELLMFG